MTDRDRAILAKLDSGVWLASNGSHQPKAAEADPLDGESVTEPYVKGAEAEALMTKAITAPGEPDSNGKQDDDEMDVPEFLKKKDSGIVGQMKQQAALLKNMKAQVSALIDRLEPILALDKEKESVLTEPLEGSPSPLLQQVWDNNNDMAKVNVRLRNIISGVQL